MSGSPVTVSLMRTTGVVVVGGVVGPNGMAKRGRNTYISESRHFIGQKSYAAKVKKN